MRVIHELIEHLWWGLSDADRAFLQERGLAPSWDDELPPDDTPFWDEPDLTPDPEPPRPRGSRRRAPRTPPPDLPALAAHVERERSEAEDALRGIDALAARVDPSVPATRALRTADPGRLADALGLSLDAHAPDLSEIWDAILVDPLPTWTMERVRRVVLAPTPVPDPLRVLSVPTLAWACDLALAQRAVLRAHCAVLDAKPATIARALHRDAHPVAYWALVLHHNARRSPREPAWGDIPALPLDSPRRVGAFERAWACAAAIEERVIGPFLAARRPDELVAGVSLYAPPNWNLRYV